MYKEINEILSIYQSGIIERNALNKLKWEITDIIRKYGSTKYVRIRTFKNTVEISLTETNYDIEIENDSNSMSIDEDTEIYYFSVIGEDRKIHVSDLQTDFCECGVKIIRKYVTEQDYTGANRTYSCYACTY